MAPLLLISRNMTTNPKDTALITGASSGIGAILADRLAKRGHDLVLVARNRERLEELAMHLRSETGRSVSVVVADLNDTTDRSRVEHVLRTNESITALVNNAGIGAPTALLDATVDRLEGMIDLNVTALVRLTYAALPGFLKRGGGTIINIASVLALTMAAGLVLEVAIGDAAVRGPVVISDITIGPAAGRTAQPFVALST